MPGKPKVGGKNKKKGKGGDQLTRELIFKEDGEEYGVVLKLLGCDNILVFCLDGVRRQCRIRGKLKCKVWIRVGDTVLISLREFSTEDKVADVIHKYQDEEVRQLRKFGEITVNPQEILDAELQSLGISAHGAGEAKDTPVEEAGEEAKEDSVNVDEL